MKVYNTRHMGPEGKLKGGIHKHKEATPLVPGSGRIATRIYDAGLNNDSNISQYIAIFQTPTISSILQPVAG